MKILFVTNMYPTKSHPTDGIFVKEQIEDLTRAINCEHDLYYINAKRKGKWNYLLSIFGIPLKILSKKYDIIHVHYGISALFLLFFKPRSPVYLTLHGSDIIERADNSWQVSITKKILRKVDKVFLQNQEMAEIVGKINKNFEIIPCGVNTDFFKPVVRRNEKDENFKIIVFPNSPSRGVKNFPLFQKVIQHLTESSTYRIEFKCVDNLSRAEVRDLFNTADCLLMTSLSEGSPQVIKEALSCGLPIVSVPVGDVKLMAAGVPHCYVSQTRSPEELSRLVQLSFAKNGDGHAIRNAFISKGNYDHVSITKRLAENYDSHLLTN